MKKKALSAVFAALAAACVCAGFSACGKTDAGSGENEKISEIYASYVAHAEENGDTPLSYEEWLKSIKGDKGEKGDTGAQGEKGADGKDGSNGKDGKNGKDGSSVTVVSVEKVKTENNVDTYQITFSDGVKSTFTVSNGVGVTVKNVFCKSSVGGVDAYEIEFSDGYTTTFTVTNGKDGKDISIIKIEKIGSEGLFDTYRISYSNNTTWDFVVSNGATPYIGTNGHWWINDTDTNVIAGYPDDDTRTHTTETMIATAGLKYSTMTINGISGYVVDGYDYSQAEEIAENYYNQYRKTMTTDEYTTYIQGITRGKAKIIIPNYIGSIPVIGIKSSAFKNNYINKISLSKNIIYIGKNAFEDSTNLQFVDFNNCAIAYIPENCFYGSGLTEISLPETVTDLHDNAFRNCKLIKFDYSDITYFGDYSLYGNLLDCIYLSKNVEYVGCRAFSNDIDYNFVYIEKDANTNGWYQLDQINNKGSYSKNYETVFTDCLRSDDMIYKVNSDNTITAYKYFKEDKIINVPNSVDGKTITVLGSGFLNQGNKFYYYDKVSSEKDIAYFAKTSTIKQVIIPDTVKAIEYGAIDIIDAFVYIPLSVASVDSSICAMSADYYENDRPTSFLAFENETLPKIYDATNGGSEVAATDFEESCVRYNTGITLSKIRYNDDDETFYYVDGLEASVLACMSLSENPITMLDTINLIPVKTILSKAYYTNAQTIKIGSNINKIQKEGLTLTNATYLYIPENVKIINKYGVNVNCSTIYIAADSIPDDWDTNWQGRSSATIKYGIKSLMLAENDQFVYFVFNDEITLISHKIDSDTIVLPSTINGYRVTAIAAGFDTQTRGKKIYIPSSIVNCEKYAFESYRGSGYAYFYFEASSIPVGFAQYWNGSSSSYANYATSQTMPEFVSKQK